MTYRVVKLLREFWLSDMGQPYRLHRRGQVVAVSEKTAVMLIYCGIAEELSGPDLSASAGVFIDPGHEEKPVYRGLKLVKST